MTSASTRELRLPGWHDWPTAVMVVQQTVAVVGESIDVDRHVLRWADRASTGEVDTVRVSPGREPHTISVTTESGDADRAEQLVRRRLHLDLDESVVEETVGRAAYPDLPADALAFRIPAAVSPWAFCLTYLSGGSAVHDVTRRLFERGERRGDLLLPPTPERFAELSQEDVEESGVTAPRARALREVAMAFTASAELDDPVRFASLPSAEAVSRVRALPRLGGTRAPLLAALAWGHHDIPYDPYSPLGAGSLATGRHTELTTAFERATPWRSVLADTIQVELLGWAGAGSA